MRSVAVQVQIALEGNIRREKVAEGFGQLLGSAFRQSFLAHLLSAFGNFVINLLDLQREGKVICILRILLE